MIREINYVIKIKMENGITNISESFNFIRQTAPFLPRSTQESGLAKKEKNQKVKAAEDTFEKFVL